MARYEPYSKFNVEAYLQECTLGNHKLPTMEGLSLYMDVSQRTIASWVKKHKEFRKAVDKLKMIQKEMLVEAGIFGGKEINAHIISLLLRVNHDMIVTERKEITGKDGKDFGVVVLPEQDKDENNLETTSRTANGGSKEN